MIKRLLNIPMIQRRLNRLYNWSMGCDVPPTRQWWEMYE